MSRTGLRLALQQYHQLATAELCTQQTDVELLNSFVHDCDERAFAVLMDRYSRLVWTACRQVLHHQEDVEDAYQATFLVLVRQAASIRRGQTVACWLYRVARRVAARLVMDQVRRQRRETKAAKSVAALPHDELSWRELQSLVHAELARLPEKYQAPFVLCCLEGKSKSQAARQLGWKEGTVSSRLAQARKRLRQRLKSHAVVSTPLLSAVELFWHQEAAPTALVRATAKAVCCVLAGGQASPLASPTAFALMQGVLRNMLVSKIKMTVVLAVVFCLTASGTVALAWRPEKEPRRESGALEVASASNEAPTEAFDPPPSQPAKSTPRPWVGIASRETSVGPELLVQFEDNHQRTYSAAADAVLLAYLEDSCLGAHEVLSVDLDDTNRILLRFDLPRTAHVRKAELLLARSQSPHPFPSEPVPLAFHEVTAPWQENQVTWKTQPAFQERPSLTVPIDPPARDYRIDITPLVRRVTEEGAPNYGWLVRNNAALACPKANKKGPPAGWSCHGSDYEFMVDDSIRLHGKHSCRIASRSAAPAEFAMMSQAIRADHYRGARVRFSAQIKTESLQGPATLWMRIDGEEGLLGIDKTVEEAVRGTTDWRPAHIVLEVPPESKTIRLAVLVEGAGKAWVDDMKLEAVDSSTPLTNQPVRPPIPPERKPGLPRQPVNMDFERIQ